jgi:hypothetical protein
VIASSCGVSREDSMQALKAMMFAVQRITKYYVVGGLEHFLFLQYIGNNHPN